MMLSYPQTGDPTVYLTFTAVISWMGIPGGELNLPGGFKVILFNLRWKNVWCFRWWTHIGSSISPNYELVRQRAPILAKPGGLVLKIDMFARLGYYVREIIEPVPEPVVRHSRNTFSVISSILSFRSSEWYWPLGYSLFSFPGKGETLSRGLRNPWGTGNMAQRYAEGNYDQPLPWTFIFG